MRDQRFVATHRGGPLDRESHTILARWAADCAERTLPFFSRCSNDPRPQAALTICRRWAGGEVMTGAAMKASVAAHAAAREVKDAAATAAARAAAHAVATAHFADHCMGALIYSMKAMEISGVPSDREFEQYIGRLPEYLRDQVASGVSIRVKKNSTLGPTNPRPTPPA